MEKDLKIVFEKPKLPLLIFLSGEIYPCKTMKEFYLKMVSIQEKEEIKIYDAHAKEFWWQDSESNYILAPAFVIKPITKKQIVEFYNNSSKGKINPFTKSYSNIKMEVLVKEIFEFSRKK